MSINKVKRTHFILAIWRQGSDEAQPVWRGSIETPIGQKHYFSQLKQLNDYLIACGWVDNTDPQQQLH